jgi:ankyrin repeat protein
MLPNIEAQLKANEGSATTVDDRGWSILHTEALAGNLGVVRLLVQYGADPRTKTPDGLEAAELARRIGWTEIAAYLSGPAQGERGTRR